MSRFFIDHHCNGHIARDCEGVEFDSVEQAGSYALAAAPQMFKDLIPGEKRECAFAVRDESQGWRLHIDLTLCLEERDPATDALDTGLLGELPGPSRRLVSYGRARTSISSIPSLDVQ
jgi:hypothetical protein